VVHSSLNLRPTSAGHRELEPGRAPEAQGASGARPALSCVEQGLAQWRAAAAAAAAGPAEGWAGQQPGGRRGPGAHTGWLAAPGAQGPPAPRQPSRPRLGAFAHALQAACQPAGGACTRPPQVRAGRRRHGGGPPPGAASCTPQTWQHRGARAALQDCNLSVGCPPDAPCSGGQGGGRGQASVRRRGPCRPPGMPEQGRHRDAEGIWHEGRGRWGPSPPNSHTP
jgi:hypothetical protein